MKRILFSILISILALSGIGWSQTGGREVFYAKSFTTSGAKDTISIFGTGIINHKILWTGAGTRTTCTIKLEQSTSGSSWTDLIVGTGCTTDGSASISGQANYVRINITALTGAGNTVFAVYDGSPVSPSSALVTLTDSGGTSITNTTAHAMNVLAVDSAGTVIPSVSYGLGIGTQVYLGTVAAGATTTADIIVMPAVGSTYNWVTSVQVVNTSSTGTHGYICNGTCATAGNRVAYFFAPPGASYVNMVPFRSSVNTDVCVAAASGVTTLYASARGWKEAY